MPSRSLIYPKLVQGECREKGKAVQSERKEGETKVFHSLPNCSRLYSKGGQSESFFHFHPTPIIPDYRPVAVPLRNTPVLPTEYSGTPLRNTPVPPYGILQYSLWNTPVLPMGYCDKAAFWTPPSPKNPLPSAQTPPEPWPQPTKTEIYPGHIHPKKKNM